MNIKSITLFVAGLIASAVSADVLYWQVNSDAVPTTKGTAAQAYLMASAAGDANSPFYVNENYLGGVNQGESVAVSSFNGSNLAGGVLDLANILSWDDPTGKTAYSGSLSALSFYIELFDASGNWVAKTDAKSYQTLLDSGAISTGSFNPSFSGVNNALGSAGVSAYSDVPEPTSGLLMLVGFGALALRRRRV